MLLFVSVCCYAKPRCYYSRPYAVMRNLDASVRVSNYVLLNLGLQRARIHYNIIIIIIIIIKNYYFLLLLLLLVSSSL